MKLSEEGMKYLQAQYEILRGEVTRWFQPEHRKVQQEAQNIGAFGSRAENLRARLLELGAEQDRRLAEGLARIYIKAYETERQELDAHEIDEIMQKINASAGQSNQALSDARNVLNSAMHESKIKSKAVRASEPVRSISNFAFVKDENIRRIVTRDYAELDQLDPGVATKSVLLLAGSILEGLLLDALVTGGKWKFGNALQKSLRDMIGAAVAQGIIREDRVSNALREYRNLVHPAREIREPVTFTQDDAKLARAAVDVAIREVSAWHAARKS